MHTRAAWSEETDRIFIVELKALIETGELRLSDQENAGLEGKIGARGKRADQKY